jgi:asparagine synthetase B (glutamine-hydrolysing)
MWQGIEMRIALQDNWTKQCHGVNASSQIWGIIRFGEQTDDMKNSLMSELHGRSDIQWSAGSNWCLVCEKGGLDNNSLASCSEGGLHAVIAGKAWPLSDKGKKDAELVADLYREHRDGLINQGDGQFCAVIIDEKNSRAVLTVNWPGGFHRLYYCTDGHSLCFATRLDLLVHRCGWQAKMNEQAVVDLFRFGGLASELSLLEGVHRVVPGLAAVFEEGRVAQRSVYEFPLCEDHDPSDTTEIVRLHREAVQKRISGHNDVGLFLSGGLDTSMNVAMAAELSSKPVRTFCVVFDDDEFDESPFARLVATRYNTRHSELRLDIDNCLDRLPEMVWAMQEPNINYSYVPTLYMLEAINEHVDVIIGGDGPDHFLGRTYPYVAWYDLLRRIPFARNTATLGTRVNGNGAKVRHSFWQYARRKRLGQKLWRSLACVSNPCGSGLLNSFCGDLWGGLAPNDLVKLVE